MIFSLLFVVGLTTASPLHRLEKLSTGQRRRADYPHMLGHGYDLSVTDLWDFSKTNALPMLEVTDLPAECARADYSCTHLSDTDIQKFSSISDAYNWFTTKNSFSFGVKFWDIAVSIKAAWGRSGSSSWFEESYGSIGIKNNVLRCHTLESTCLAPNGGNLNLNSRLQDTLDAEDATKAHTDPNGCSPSKLGWWGSEVITQFGTHLATQTRNGAMMRYKEFESKSGTDRSQCMFDSVCVAMELAKIPGVEPHFGFCTNTTSCATSTGRDSSLQYKCVAVGGEDEYTSDMLCNPDADPPTIANFFEPSDESLNSDHTVVGLDFEPIENLATSFGVEYNTHQTLRKAREYHMCKALPSHVWQWSTDECGSGGEGSCKCIRTCENGGQLNEDTCTCSCLGDDMHGWKGETCTETYGSCQPGAGTGNPTGARNCPITGVCYNGSKGDGCSPTEVCCMTNFMGICCPLGSSCSCGVGKCECRSPLETLLGATNNFFALPGMGPLPTPSANSSSYTMQSGVSCRKQKIKVEKNGVMKTFKTRNFSKAKEICDDLGDRCVGVMDSGCDGEGKYNLCEKSDEPLKTKSGHCIHFKDENQ